MDILNLMKEFPNQESCLRFIKEKRWKYGVCCIHCGSEKVGRKNKNDITTGWNYYDCESSFSATAGTIFHGTKDTSPEMVFGYLNSFQCQEKHIELSACS